VKQNIKNRGRNQKTQKYAEILWRTETGGGPITGQITRVEMSVNDYGQKVNDIADLSTDGRITSNRTFAK
jgi:hypothetical protein